MQDPIVFLKASSSMCSMWFKRHPDHLGNVRVNFEKGAGNNAVAVQRNDYYPFGLRHSVGYPSNDNKYLYNGKELQWGTGWLDYGERMYDPLLGRWHAVDPHAENYFHTSLYGYVENNPINRIDPNGRDWDVVIDHESQVITIIANFNTFSGNEETLQNSAEAWNAQSGKFNYVIGKGDESVSYTVNFNVTVNTNDVIADNTVSVVPDNAKIFQERKEVDASGNEKIIKPQGATDGKNIAIKSSNKENVNVTSHEIGHNLGMGHSSGLMRTTAGGNSLSKKSVRETLGHSGVSKRVKETVTNATMQNKTVIGTAPSNFQEGKLRRRNDWKKTNFK